MTRKLPPMNSVRAFEAAARHVSFTKAGEELHVTHGAISRQVSQLESWLGTPLFRRLASQLTLTDAGRSYARELTSLLDRLAVASSHLRERGSPAAALNVSAPPTFTMRWLIPRLSGFQRQRADIEVRLTTSIAPVNFHENAYDIAIRGATQGLPGCTSQPFMTEVIVPVCHRDLMEGNRLREPADLASHTLISYHTAPHTWEEWLRDAGVANLKPVSTLDFEQMFFALQAALEGLGVVLVPLFLVIDDIVASRLCVPFGALGAKHRRYFANTDESSADIEAFYGWLLREGRDTEQSILAWAKAAGWNLDFAT